MNKLRFYINTVRRHAHYGSRRMALSYALRHWRFWQGADTSGEPYVHIGSRKEKP